MIGQVLLALTFLVAIHEWGHFFPAKRFKIRVTKFYLFFDFLFPLPEVLNFSLFKFKKGETEYGLGWFPLGGYVKIEGMVDESMDLEHLDKEPEPWEFRAKPAWQRMIVMLGGIIVNTIAGVIIFILTLFVYGETYTPLTEMKKGIGVASVGTELGFQDGDKILNVNGTVPEGFEDIFSADLLLGDDSYITISRKGEEKKMTLPSDMLDKINGGRDRALFIELYSPFKISAVQEEEPAQKAGLQADDQIIAVNGVNSLHFPRLQELLYQNRRKTVDLTIVRNGSEQIIKNVEVSRKGKIGIQVERLIEYKRNTRYFTFSESIPKGISNAFQIFSNSFIALKKVITGQINFMTTFNSPVGIGKAFGTEWIWERFWKLTGMISMALAFMNLLPIPMLDGGYVVFLIYEMIAGRKPSDKFLENTNKVGMVILLTLTVVLLGKDIWFEIADFFI